MANPSAADSVSEGDTTSPHGDGQQAFAGFGKRLRSRAESAGFNAARLAKRLKITRGTMARYWNGERLPPTELLLTVSDLLDCDPRWLVRGRNASAWSHLVGAGDAEWVEISEYDLRKFDEHGKGDPAPPTPFRRDWLNKTFGTANDLWLARAPSDYPPQQIESGEMIILRDIKREELSERQLLVWRLAPTNQLLIGRFSHLVRGESVIIEDAGEYWVHPHLVAGAINVQGSQGDLIPLGRILGRPLAAIR